MPASIFFGLLGGVNIPVAYSHYLQLFLYKLVPWIFYSNKWSYNVVNIRCCQLKLLSNKYHLLRIIQEKAARTSCRWGEMYEEWKKQRETLGAKAKRFSAKRKGRKSDVTSAVLALVYRHACIQCIKVLAPNLPHGIFFPLGLCIQESCR